MSGSLVCVGTGMTLGAHISPICRSYIEEADIVFSLMSNGIVEKWIDSMNNNVVSLQPFYQEGKNRNVTYNEMVNEILTAAKQGMKVVAAFYGHPGVFACVAHRAIAAAKAENIDARMEPGISAEDCLYADLAIDPGKTGCQHYEASQFMFYKKNIETSAYLILWQIGLAGDKSLTKYATSQEHKKALVDLLSQHYPLDHQVILYQAKVLPVDKLRAESLALSELANADIYMHTTLVIPPYGKMVPNQQYIDRLAVLDEQEEKSKLRAKLTLIN